jgi:hypothetical protein
MAAALGISYSGVCERVLKLGLTVADGYPGGAGRAARDRAIIHAIRTTTTSFTQIGRQFGLSGERVRILAATVGIFGRTRVARPEGR